MEIQMWKEILNPYELAVEELQVKFNHMVKEYRQAGIYSPIEQVLGRVKSISSILLKAQKHNIDLNEIEGHILDIAGIRLICQFTDDIYNVADLIRARSDMEVITEKDYVKNIKESGYRSYHIIVQYKVETVKGTKIIPVEIQIRTLGMNFWAIIEHSLQYKYNGNIPRHVRERLTSAADAIYTLDNEMMSIHDEIIDLPKLTLYPTYLIIYKAFIKLLTSRKSSEFRMNSMRYTRLMMLPDCKDSAGR